MNREQFNIKEILKVAVPMACVAAIFVAVCGHYGIDVSGVAHEALMNLAHMSIPSHIEIPHGPGVLADLLGHVQTGDTMGILTSPRLQEVGKVLSLSFPPDNYVSNAVREFANKVMP